MRRIGISLAELDERIDALIDADEVRAPRRESLAGWLAARREDLCGELTLKAEPCTRHPLRGSRYCHLHQHTAPEEQAS